MKVLKRKAFYATLIFLGVIVGIIFTTGLSWIPIAKTSDNSTAELTSARTDEASKKALMNFSDVFEEIAEEFNSSVVSIFNEQIVKSSTMSYRGQNDPFRDFFGDDFFRRFFGNPERQQERRVQGLGSGVIVSDDGYILTNNHVIEKAAKLTITLNDEKKYEAEVIGADPQTDLAVVKIDAKKLPAARLGDSDKLRIGEWVLAIGNPFHLMRTVTAGIISAKGRANVGLAAYEDFIQTDAAINPGNSGGALVNLNGELVGINTAIFSRSGGYQGIGFAIPVNMAKRVMEDLIEKGKVTRGYLGLYPQDIDENLATAFDLQETDGALVAEVTKDQAAAKAGIQQGDIIVEFDDKKIKNSTQLRNVVAATKPGKKVHVKVLRKGKERTINVVLAERPETSEIAATPKKLEHNWERIGVQVQEMDDRLAKQLGYEGEQGVVVSSVQPGSPAQTSGLRRGDLIKAVNRKPIKSIHDYGSIVDQVKQGDALLFLIRRGQNNLFVAIRILK
ncbi:MAG: Do family serine endopeptidase [Candidatus Aminicenantes bacterium]|nr:Do family serine endopeptidase [Candidatus Aminicenantes bacterium]